MRTANGKTQSEAIFSESGNTYGGEARGKKSFTLK